MSWPLAADGPWLPCLGLAVNVTASHRYVLATARGEVRPSSASWFALALVPGLALVAAVAAEARVGAVTAAAAAVVPASVLVAAAAAALRRRRRARVERPGPQDYLDAAALGACAGAVLVWEIVDNPVVLLVDSVLIGLLATAPTLVRAWCGHERVGPFAGRIAAATCALPLVPQWTVVADWLYAAFQLVTGVLLCVVVVARRPPARHGSSRPGSVPATVVVARLRPDAPRRATRPAPRRASRR